MARASNDGGEDSPGSVITGETGLAHSGSIVDDKSSGVLVTHLGRVWVFSGSEETETVTNNCGLTSEVGQRPDELL